MISSNNKIDHDPAQQHNLLSWITAHRTQILAICFSLAITIAIILLRDQLVKLRSYGYLGVFLISVIGNATVILPVPSMAIVFAGGGVLNPLLVGLVGGLGEPIGELTGYLAGYGGSAVIENSERFERLKTRMSGKGGFATIYVLSAIPNPVFDLAGIAAGMMHYPVMKFLVACWLGKTTKAIAIAYLGSVSIKLLEPLFG